MIAIAKAPKRRLSLQIIRVARELETLHVLGESTVSAVQLAMASLPPKPVCRRTIFRDMEALAEAGFLTRRVVKTWIKAKDGRKLFRDVYRYSLATPVELRRRLELISKLTPRQVNLLSQGKSIAEESKAP